VYHNLGKAYENLKRYPDAEKYYLQELSLLEKKTEQKTLQKTDAYLSLGNTYEKQGKISQALNYYQRAIVNSIVDFKPAGLENPPLKNILSKRRLFIALQSKYRTQHKINVNTAAQTCELALALLDSTANEYSLDRDKVILQEQSIQAFEDGINMSYDLFHKTQDQKYFDNCFALIERSKGKVLLENLRMVNQFASVNPSLLESEREIKSELLLVEQSIFKGELAASPPADLPAMRERYADLKHDYANLIQNIKHNAPDYYKLRFDHHVVDLQKIKTELLQPEEALIEFFVGDSTLITIAVTSSKQHITQKKISTEFFEDLHDLRKLLSNPETDLKQLKAKSKEWYTLLLGDVLSKLDDQIRSLIIVPDVALGYIPFEVLIAPDDQYVIEKYSTRYAQSATYLNEQEHVLPRRSSSFFGGFISSEDEGIRNNGTVNTNLVGAKKEIEFVAKMVGSEATIFNQATKQDFLQEASKFNVLHLAMHSMVNEKNPMLSVMAFSGSHDSINSQLTAIEIYNQHLNADLAVLSACNTGFGELHRGEGIMSFARAFSYAGVSSAAISLWEVPDKATSKIMINFYNYLKAGKTKAEALQLAKVEFINSYAAMAHPFYWSGFILSGSNKPLQFPTSSYWYWTAAGVVLLLIFFLMRRRFTTKKA